MKLFRQIEIEFTKKKKPVEKQANYVGVELEFVSLLPREFLMYELDKSGLTKYCNITSDGSIKIRVTKEYDIELKVMAKQEEIHDILSKVLDVINNTGATVNKSCGLHVHLDMRNRKVTDCYTKLVNSLPELKKLVSKSRLYSDYCRMNKDNNFRSSYGFDEKVHDTWNSNRTVKRHIVGTTGRHHAINPQAYHRHKTLEVRLHEGSLDKSKISSWINKLTSIID